MLLRSPASFSSRRVRFQPIGIGNPATTPWDAFVYVIAEGARPSSSEPRPGSELTNGSMAYLHHVAVAPRLAFSSHGDAPPCVPKVASSYHKHIAVAARPPSSAARDIELHARTGPTEEDQLASSGGHDRSMESAAAAEEEEKVFVAVPAERRAGQSTLAWALRHLYGGAGTTIVVAHVRVPSQMIPIMGVKFHASMLSPESVGVFRRAERERADEMLDDYIQQCSEIKVKCEKLVIEKEDAASGLVELIRLHRITKLVIAAAGDRHYSRKLDKPMSKTATEIMQRADPSCKIWFVCKEQLVCIRDKQVQIAPLAVAAPLLPILGHEVQHLQSPQQEDDIEMELGLDDELEEARKAVEELMRRALIESRRRQKAEQEMAASLHKAQEHEELYLEEVKKREELEAALARADREIARLRQAIQRNAPREASSRGDEVDA